MEPAAGYISGLIGCKFAMGIEQGESTMMNKRLGALLLGPALVLGSSVVLADSHMKPDCTVDISRTEVGFIVTIGGGSGTLTCAGKTHKFRIGGLKVGAAGIASSSATGEVFGLKKLADFNGTYSETKAQATVGKGKNVMDLANDKGVRMHLRGTSEGVDMQLAGGGLKVTLE
jgi:hypothetical protein